MHVNHIKSLYQHSFQWKYCVVIWLNVMPSTLWIDSWMFFFLFFFNWEWMVQKIVKYSNRNKILKLMIKFSSWQWFKQGQMNIGEADENWFLEWLHSNVLILHNFKTYCEQYISLIFKKVYSNIMSHINHFKCKCFKLNKSVRIIN